MTYQSFLWDKNDGSCNQNLKTTKLIIRIEQQNKSAVSILQNISYICNSGLGCSKLGYVIPGLVWNLRAYTRNLVYFLLCRIWLCDAIKKGIEKIILKRLLRKGIKKPALKFNLGLAPTSLQTTGPSQGTEYKVFPHVA